MSKACRLQKNLTAFLALCPSSHVFEIPSGLTREGTSKRLKRNAGCEADFGPFQRRNLQWQHPSREEAAWASTPVASPALVALLQVNNPGKCSARQVRVGRHAGRLQTTNHCPCLQKCIFYLILHLLKYI